MDEKFKLKFSRSGLTGCAMAIYYEIDHDSTLSGKISFSSKPELELSKQTHHVRLYLKRFPFSKQTEKEFLIDPSQDTTEMLVNLSLKLNFIGMFPPISFFYPTCYIMTKISYN